MRDQYRHAVPIRGGTDLAVEINFDRIRPSTTNRASVGRPAQAAGSDATRLVGKPEACATGYVISTTEKVLFGGHPNAFCNSAIIHTATVM